MFNRCRRSTLKRILSLIVISLLCLPAAAVCNAVTSVKASYNADDESITVSLVTEQKEKTAVLTIEKDGKYWALAEFERTAKDLFEYTCDLPTNCPSGEYTATVTIGGVKATDNFNHINKRLAQIALNYINAATEENFASVIESVHEELVINVDEFNNYGELLTKLYYKYKPNSDLTVVEFSTLYNKCLALSKMHAQTDIKVTEAFLIDNASKIEFDYDKFDALTENEKNEILGRFQSGVYSEADLATQYSHWFCLADINTKRDSSTSAYKKALLETNHDLLNLDVSDYNNSPDQNEVIRLVMEREYNSIEGVRNAFYAAVSSVKNENKKNNKNSGSGSHSGSSGGTGLIDWNAGAEKEIENNAADVGVKGIFSDVTGDYWCAIPIQKLYERGIISGVGNSKFLPDDSVTRAEFSKMLINALFGNYKAASNADFNDVSEGDWYIGYISAAVEMGIITGAGEGNFMPNETITRQDMAVMLYRALNKSNTIKFAESKTFEDNGMISEYAKEAVSMVGGAGILNGMEGGLFHPRGVLSRAHAVKALYEALNACANP